MSHEDLLYYELIGDFATFVILKIFTNHNMEFFFQLNGHMSESFCLSMVIIGQMIDFVITFYILDMVFVRYAKNASKEYPFEPFFPEFFVSMPGETLEIPVIHFSDSFFLSSMFSSVFVSNLGIQTKYFFAFHIKLNRH